MGLCGTVLAQDSDVTEVTTETTVLSAADLTSELWLMDDATPIATGAADLRMTFRWVTASAPANLGDSDDDFVLEPSLRWGPCKNVEVFASVPIWLGDGGDMGAVEDGNGDTYVGFTWRLLEPQDIWPALALGATARIPTGDGSSGVDAELRLILTNEYDSGIRSHINIFGKSVNKVSTPVIPIPPPRGGPTWGDPSPHPSYPRHFQWGVVLGLDGPLCADGAVRWVADYMNRSSYHYGAGNLNILELGWEWTMSEAHKLGMSMQIGLDDNDDTPNFGAGISYAYSLMY
jgi:hypothetical protein